MSEEIWNIQLGDRTFAVPRLPFKYGREIYPICQKLSNDGFPERIMGKFEGDTFVPPPPLQVTDEEMMQLGRIAFMACQAADPELNSSAFEEMPITPPQLFDAFFAIRKACGGWRSRAEGKEPTGEAKGMVEPPTSTLTGSSEN